MNILVSVIISAVMVLGSLAWQNEHKPAVGANTMISALTTGTSLDDADYLIYNDNSGTPTTKKITWGNATSSLQTYYNGVYQTLLVNSAGLRGALSDETGTGVAVFGTGPTIGTPTLTAPTFDVAGTDATGDTYYNGGSGLFTRLAIGSSGQFLMASTTGIPEWNSTNILTNPQTASSTFTATTTHTGALITAGVSVGFNTATSSGNIIVANNASTTNLTISGKCVGCLNGYTVATSSSSFNHNISSDGGQTVSCPTGMYAVGGGAGSYSGGDQSGYSIKESRPSGSTGWYTAIRTGSGTGATSYLAYVICAYP